jgi:hypothetical protein
MRNTSTLNLEVERKKYLIKKVNHNVITQYTEILPRKPKPKKPPFLERYALSLSYSFIIKGYMSNLGQLRHNRHHTLFLTQEQPCSQFILHLHDQQPLQLLIDLLAFTALQHTFFIGFTVGKTLNKWHPKTVTDSCRSLAKNPMNIGILLQSIINLDYQSAFIWSSVSCHTPTFRPIVG